MQKTFILKIIAFSGIFIAILTLCLFFLPDKKSASSIFGAFPAKHQLLSASTSPKIIYVGGSSTSMGINSKMVVDSFHMPVVNNGLSGFLGLQFIIDDVEPYINKGDIVVLMSEYTAYENTPDNEFNGHEELLPVLFSILPAEKKYVNYGQWLHMSKFLPHYTFSKIKQVFYNPADGMYNKNAFNTYGDFTAHWGMANMTVKPQEPCKGDEQVHPDLIPFLKSFQKYISDKGARLYILPPPLQATSFTNQTFIIDKISTEFKKAGLPLIAEPADYKMDDQYFFDYCYHLDKKGVDIHTQYIIRDLKKVIK